LSAFEKHELKFDIEYYYDEFDHCPEADILSQQFVPVQAYPFNNGLKSGSYWFRVKIHATGRTGMRAVLEIREPYIKQSKLYKINKGHLELLHTSGNDVPLAERPIASRNISYPVTLSSEHDEFMIKADFHRNTSFIFYAHSEQEYFLHEQNSFLYIGGYYGISFIICLINLILYFSYKERIYLYYSSTIMLISVALLHLDGMFVFILPPGWFFDNVDIFCYAMLPFVGGYYFAGEYLNIRELVPWSKYFERVFFSLTAIILLLFLITENVLFFALGVSSMLISLSYYWVVSLRFVRKNKFVALFCTAYTLLAVLAVLFSVPVMFGYDFLKGESSILKIGGVAEMVIILYSVVLKGRLVREENEKMQADIQDFICKVEELESHSDQSPQVYDFSLLKNRYDLTKREMDVLEEITKSQTNVQIAENLNVSVNTIKYHTKNIYQKLDIKGRHEVIDVLAQEA